MFATQDEEARRGMRRPAAISLPKGTLGVLTPGMGAVSTTFMAGVELVRRGCALPIGSVTQLATIRLGKRTDGRSPLIRDFVPLEKLDSLVEWDPAGAYQLLAGEFALRLEHKKIIGVLDEISLQRGSGVRNIAKIPDQAWLLHDGPREPRLCTEPERSQGRLSRQRSPSRPPCGMEEGAR